MAIPVYVVTGFLDSGKSSFINGLLNRSEWRNVNTLVVQFEIGETELQSQNPDCQSVAFSKKELERQPDKIVKQIAEMIKKGKEIEEIWVEWNGVVPFSQLQAMMSDNALRGLCKIRKVMHIANAADIENLLGRTGGALPEQIANSNFAVLRNADSSDNLKRIRRAFKGINSGIPVYLTDKNNELDKRLFQRKEHPVNFFFAVTVAVIALYFLYTSFFGGLQNSLNTVVNIFLGIILQAIPFLLIGVMLSAIIQVFVPQRFIERRFPKSMVLGMITAIIGSFCLPVCDCASIPIFRSLVRKGIPLPVAVTFMTAAPVINPVVIVSTYYAFGGNAKVAMARVGLGIVAAVIIGLFFSSKSAKTDSVLSGGALDRLMCNCGCYEDLESVTTFRKKAELFIRHSQSEFFNVGKYLVIGTFIASVFQTLGTGAFAAAQSGAGLAASILIMMAMAFLLSLCSSSDAVIASSFMKQFPMGALMGFLVFGPMTDIKNVMMLSSGFTKRFIGKLLLVTFVVCFFTVFLFFRFGGIQL